MMRRSPLNQRSKRNRDLLPEQAAWRKEVMARAGSYCEICGERAHPATLEWAHLYGRTGKISPPMSSWPELTLGAHRGCHVALDRYSIPERLDQLRWEAVYSVVKKFGAEPPFSIPDDEWTPMRAMQWLEDHQPNG